MADGKPNDPEWRRKILAASALIGEVVEITDDHDGMLVVKVEITPETYERLTRKRDADH